MTGKFAKVLLIATVALLCLPVTNHLFAQGKPGRKHTVKRQKDPAPPTPDPVQPPAPLTKAQLPAVAPQVSYHNGQLTIVAQNSSLGDILRAVKQQTGADIEVPENANERVVGHMGPGSPRDVLALLLNGSHFDYVMTASAQNPASLERLLLMPKAAGDATAASVTQANATQPAHEGQPGIESQPEQEVDTTGAPEDLTSQDLEDNEQPLDQPAQDEGQQDQQQAEQPQPGTFNGQPAIKTPEQLLQELQQRQQQLQQQQQGSPQGVPQAAPQGFPIPPGAQPPQPEQQAPPPN
jgi:hypothetical protein